MNSPQTTHPADATADLAGNSKRKRALSAVALLVLLGGIVYGVYYALVLNHFESTDNAYVQGNVVQLTPQIGGTVLSINADDTDFVKAGQPLVKLDTADAKVALEQAEAQLAQTVREVRTLFANNGTLGAQIALREADLRRARSELMRAQDDVDRRAPLLATGAVGQEEFNHANSQLAAARSAVAAARSAALAARGQFSANQVLTENTSVEAHPNVQRAAARVRETLLAVRRAELLSPVDGHVARRSVQLGQRVQAGTPLMSVIPLNRLWVDVNLKESQLRDVRIGQPVQLQADVYGRKVEYHGVVEGLGAGTGAAFALLPAQNATGNWIKVVQRVPVRVALDPKELAAHPLRLGLSMDARVDVSRTDGKMLAESTTRPSSESTTSVFDELDADADQQVKKIIALNLGAPVKPEPPSASSRASASASQAVEMNPAPLERQSRAGLGR